MAPRHRGSRPTRSPSAGPTSSEETTSGFTVSLRATTKRSSRSSTDRTRRPELVVVDEAPEGELPNDLPPHAAAFAPDDDPEEIAEIARKLRSAAGLGDEPLGKVSNEDGGLVGKVKDKIG
jgi:hypothetical protein